MKLTRNSIVWAFGVSIAVCAIVLLAIWSYGTCASQNGKDYEQLKCYVDRTGYITKTYGIATTLEYVDHIIYPLNGVALTHTVLHTVGSDAYDQDPSLASLALYIQPYMKKYFTSLPTDPHVNNQFQNTFDGFIHGFVTEYLEGQGTSTPIALTAAAICNSDALGFIPGLDGLMCYHAIGHGIMHAQGNKLSDSLALCDELIMTANVENKPTALTRCYTGVFMENEFLYLPSYHAGSARPDVVGSSMKSICQRFSGLQLHVCLQEVGISYLFGHDGDIRGAIAECKSISTPTEADTCLNHLKTSVFFAKVIRGNLDTTTATEYCSMFETFELNRKACVSEAKKMSASYKVQEPAHGLWARLKESLYVLKLAALTL